MKKNPRKLIYIFIALLVVGLLTWRTKAWRMIIDVEQPQIMEVGEGGRRKRVAPIGKTGRNAGGGAGNDIKISTKYIPNGAKVGEKKCSFDVKQFEFVCIQEILVPNTQTGQTP